MFDNATITIGKAKYEVRQNDNELFVNGQRFDMPEFALTDRLVRVRINDSIEEFVVNRNGDDLWLSFHGRAFPLVIETEREKLLRVASQDTEGGMSGAIVKAQMPGLVVRIAVKVGDTVKRSDPVLILEAMKMENEVRAPADGVVKEVRVKERDSVDKGTVMLVLE
ncbi:MAG: biotin/lipoyl-binding protein [Calditrichaeota bacterium]|nr:biotin/lipoyl-binding protein [Calditrichota bacterium]MCB9391172.1 biotin/lipoyl-binding protein [Calditrichota bacterium]